VAQGEGPEFKPNTAFKTKQNKTNHITNTKRAGNMAQMVELLPSKLKVLSSIPGTRKNK
jgi:type III secretory pathway component EscU